MARLVIDGYGQVELNNCAFRRDGRIEAQCKPNVGTKEAPADFASVPVENGMLLAVDRVNRLVKLPKAANEDLPIALVYSAEHMYDERKPGLKNFKLEGKEDFLPRLGYLAVGDLWTENCVDLGTYASADAIDPKAAAVYGGIHTSGAILLSATKPTVGPVLKVVEKTTMPDGQVGFKFQCVAFN